jgi:hypothetical protein
MAFDISCLYLVDSPLAYAGCMQTLSNNLLFTIAYICISIIIIGGFSYTQGIERGLVIGGYLTSIIGALAIGITYVNTSILPIASVMCSLALFLIASVVLVIGLNKYT